MARGSGMSSSAFNEALIQKSGYKNTADMLAASSGEMDRTKIVQAWHEVGADKGFKIAGTKNNLSSVTDVATQSIAGSGMVDRLQKQGATDYLMSGMLKEGETGDINSLMGTDTFKPGGRILARQWDWKNTDLSNAGRLSTVAGKINSADGAQFESITKLDKSTRSNLADSLAKEAEQVKLAIDSKNNFTIKDSNGKDKYVDSQSKEAQQILETLTTAANKMNTALADVAELRVTNITVTGSINQKQ
jgi:hypothetical protein